VKAKVVLAVYALVSAVHLAACLLRDIAASETRGGYDVWWIFAVTKCALMPLLMLWLRASAPAGAADLPFGRVQAALLACLVGDAALLAPGMIPFLLGMGAFGAAHVLYMTAWMRPVGWRAQLVADRLVYVLPLFVFVYIVYSKASGGMEPAMRPAILAYMTLLVGDCFCAFLRRNAIDAPSSASILNGAFLFVQSDSLIALNEFLRKGPDGRPIEPGMPWAQFMIMATYIVGQYLIVRGCIARASEAPGDAPPAAPAA